MKVYVVADLNYDGGIAGTYTNKPDAEKAVTKFSRNERHGPRYEYCIYPMELRGSKERAKIDG